MWSYTIIFVLYPLLIGMYYEAMRSTTGPVLWFCGLNLCSVCFDLCSLFSFGMFRFLNNFCRQSQMNMCYLFVVLISIPCALIFVMVSGKGFSFVMDFYKRQYLQPYFPICGHDKNYEIQDDCLMSSSALCIPPSNSTATENKH